jgi:bacterioferritin-associated ferredoxin
MSYNSDSSTNFKIHFQLGYEPRARLAFMIICSCNFLTDREVRTVVITAVRPPTTLGQVYKCLGCRPKCGRCARSISLIMGEALGNSRFIYPSAPSNGDDTADWLSSRFARVHVRPLNCDNHLAEYRLV